MIVAGVLAVQFHGSSVCSSCCFVRPETMRSSTSVRYAIGLDTVQLRRLDQRHGKNSNDGPRHPTGRHDAGCPVFEVEISYPFHPLFHRIAMVVRTQVHDNIQHLTVCASDGSSFLLPWVDDNSGGRLYRD